VHLLDLPTSSWRSSRSRWRGRAGRRPARVGGRLPEGALIISRPARGTGFVPKADTVIEAGDEVLLVLDPGLEACSAQSRYRRGSRRPPRDQLLVRALLDDRPCSSTTMRPASRIVERRWAMTIAVRPASRRRRPSSILRSV
jgi:hypothetical protein